MVFFTCTACGESLKKNQVEKHYMHKCRRCEVLTCVDCHKDFPGDTYQSHTKCISENEKYSAKGWQPKESANKGEKKQQAWIQNIQELLDDEKKKADLSSDVQRVLDTILHHENIPRKKQKFINFVKNIMRGVRPSVIDETWSLFEEACKPKVEKVEEKEGGEEGLEEDKESPKEAEERLGVKMFQGINTIGCENGKKEKKSKKNKKGGKKELCEKENEEETVAKKSSKKRKRDQEMVEQVEDNELKPKKKKKKGKDQEPEENLKLNETLEEMETNAKFSWEESIEKVLQKKGALKLTKLKKKVINDYVESCEGQVLKTHEELGAKLEKKLKKNRKFKLLKDTVTLVD